MTVSAAKERRDRRSASYPKDGVRNYRRVFLVITDTKTDGPNAILQAAGLPTKLSFYVLENESDLGAVVTNLTPRQLRKSPLHWEVDVDYSTDVDLEKEEENDNPLSQPDVVTFGFEAYRVIAHEDVGGVDPVPLINSAEQPFDPPLMIDDSRPVLTIVRNQATFNALQAIDFKDAVNDDAFLGADVGQVKLRGITATKDIERGNPEFKFWRVTYVFLFHHEGWKLRPLDTGTRVHAANGVDFEPYTEDGVVTEIQLDGKGNKLGVGENDVFLEFDVYKKRTFADLQIDHTLNLQNAQP